MMLRAAQLKLFKSSVRKDSSLAGWQDFDDLALEMSNTATLFKMLIVFWWISFILHSSNSN